MTVAEKLTAIAENEQKVFDAGKKAEYDRFWDVYQANGTRLQYAYGFAGAGWTEYNFRPKYDIKPTVASNLFTNTSLRNVKDSLEKAGVTLDMSNVVTLSYLAQSSALTHLPVLDLRKVANLNYFLFQNQGLLEVEKIILKDDGTQSFSDYTFNNLPLLTEVRFEGIIGKNGLNFGTTPKLSHDSLMSIINALQTKTSGTWTVTLGATNLAKLTDAEKAIATQKGWTLA